MFISGLIIFAACATFTGLNYTSGYIIQNDLLTIGSSPFHYSFYFGWISGFFYLLSGVFAVIAGRSK